MPGIGLIVTPERLESTTKTPLRATTRSISATPASGTKSFSPVSLPSRGLELNVCGIPARAGFEKRYRRARFAAADRAEILLLLLGTACRIDQRAGLDDRGEETVPADSARPASSNQQNQLDDSQAHAAVFFRENDSGVALLRQSWTRAWHRRRYRSRSGGELLPSGTRRRRTSARNRAGFPGSRSVQIASSFLSSFAAGQARNGQ